jgi:hypothetical protein
MGKRKPSTRTKWRSCPSARRRVLRSYLTPPTLLEIAIFHQLTIVDYNSKESRDRDQRSEWENVIPMQTESMRKIAMFRCLSERRHPLLFSESRPLRT